MLVAGTDLPLWGMEIDPEQGKAEFMMDNASGTNPGGRRVTPKPWTLNPKIVRPCCIY